MLWFSCGAGYICVRTIIFQCTDVYSGDILVCLPLNFKMGDVRCWNLFPFPFIPLCIIYSRGLYIGSHVQVANTVVQTFKGENKDTALIVTVEVT